MHLVLAEVGKNIRNAMENSLNKVERVRYNTITRLHFSLSPGTPDYPPEAKRSSLAKRENREKLEPCVWVINPYPGWIMPNVAYPKISGIPEAIKEDIVLIAKELGVTQVILFGSRATGEAWERSDIDLAAPFENSTQFWEFKERLERIRTLLIFDVINLNSDLLDMNLRKSINDEGVTLYEKV